MSTTTVTASSNHFETPTLDSESSTLLQTISEHGGYAYVSMASLASSGDFRAAEAAREMAWEQLHCGPWHSVLPIWRDAYSMACLHVAKHHYANGEFEETLRVLDMGLIMGGILLRNDLENAVQKVSAAKANGAGKGFGKSESPMVSQKFNEVELRRVLPMKSLSCKMVVKRSSLSLEGFLREHFLPGSPVIISDCMAHWPARTKWNDMDYLRKVAGDRTVPVEDSNCCLRTETAKDPCMKLIQKLFLVGKNYLFPDWKQELITFSQFLERIQSDDCSSGPTYLAQHPLFDQINELRKDICIPDYCFAGGGELRSLNAWFGPAGTVTPLHHDPHHNILAQVVGKKYIRLYSASVSEDLYPYTETMLKNSSQVDLDNIDDKAYPKMQDLEFVDCILEEGEMLYIPPKWWHYVRSLTTSLSVSFWWSESNAGSSVTS